MKKTLKILSALFLIILVCYAPGKVVFADEQENEDYDYSEDAEYYKYYSKNGYREDLNPQESTTDNYGNSLYAARGTNRIMGCDVSHWNGNIDWNKAKKQGLQYTFIKAAGRGRTNGIISDDSKYQEYIKGALDAGLRVGVYFYSEAITVNEAVEEANYLIEKVKNYNVTLPLVIDYEGFNSNERIGQANLSKAQYTEIVKAFCATVKNAGYTPMVYASASFYTKYLDGESLSRYYRIWTAAYSHQPDHYNKVTYDFWQFTSTADGRAFGMGSTYVDLDYWYDDGSNFSPSLSGLCYDGSTDNDFNCHYYKNGVIDKTYSGVAYYEGKWYKVKNGRIDTSFTGLAQNENGWWYVQNGIVTFNYNGICSNSYGDWYVKGSKVQFGTNGLVNVNNSGINGDNGRKYSFSGWYYIVSGKVQYSGEYVVQNESGWWYVHNGMVDFGAYTVAQNQNGWWVIQKGQVNFGFNGLAKNSNGIWYCLGGKVQFGVRDVKYFNQSGYQGWYYLNNGQVQLGTETVAQNQNGWWYIGTDGKVDFSKYTVAQNQNGWWVIQKGQVNFGFNGLAKNSNGIWYCLGGKVQFGVRDVKYFNQSGYQGWYYLNNGQVQLGTETVAQNQNGWWYIGTDGKVDFSKYTVAKNQYGWWVIQNGQVNFNYKGLASNQNGLWYIENGKVTFSYNNPHYKDTKTGNYYKIVNSRATLIES